MRATVAVGWGVDDGAGVPEGPVAGRTEGGGGVGEEGVGAILVGRTRGLRLVISLKP